ncbi:MAG: hypothetical protein MUF73_08875 [Rhodobacteraceae bacterium]|jgi:hypothetical protein|nr:hypothetical protein [Paracoccaceae bacterium]
MRRFLAALLLPLLLAACGTAERTWAPDDEVARAVYRHDAPPSLTLVTVLATRDGSGAHSALVVNAPSQRVLFDPAGSFRTDILPERNDVIFGMTPRALEIYADYHARVTFDVVLQEFVVPPEVAERALMLVQAHGPAPQATCANAVSGILRQLPGFDDAPATWFPRRLMDWADSRSLVARQVVQDDDSNDNRAVLATVATQYPGRGGTP